jgi:Putative Actinobacterial Holin-X, holin superfamily III
MATDLKNENEPSMTSVVSGIVHDAQELLEQQVELLKHEIRADIRQAKVATQVLSVGAAFGLVGGLLLGVALALLLQFAAPDLPLWACYAICGGALLALGAGFFAAGVAKLHAINPVPEQSAEALKENLQWTMKPK